MGHYIPNEKTEKRKKDNDKDGDRPRSGTDWEDNDDRTCF
jgi:hypothetical protein